MSWPAAGHYRVAYSGGLDSTVLLDVLNAARKQLPGRLSAVHVNHGIHPARATWEDHCRNFCRGLDVELAVLKVEASPVRGCSPEARARQERYRVLRELLDPNDMLLTAHTQDDQAETVLLQLCRGSGPGGLAAMPEVRALGPGRHGRPLLSFERSCLREYAEDRGLVWIEDDSNLDQRFDRNFVRHEIIPKLRGRWPGVAATIARAAAHQAHALEILAAVAASDLQVCQDPDQAALDLRRVRELSRANQANLLRHWAKELGLPVPDSGDVQRILDEVMTARRDGMPLVSWPGAELRRYRDQLYISAPLSRHDPGTVVNWRLEQPCQLDCGTLLATTGRGSGLRMNACPGSKVEIRFRRGGEKLRPQGSRHRRDLKTLMQERGIPPWLRDRFPLLYVGSDLAAVAGLWVDGNFAAAGDEMAWQIDWRAADQSPGRPGPQSIKAP